MSSIPLRKKGPLVKPLHWGMAAAAEPPRALKSLARIVDGDLCHRCGSCVGICPTDVLGVDNSEYPVVNNLSACTDCDLCVKVCPGDQFDADSVAREMFGEVPDQADMHGHFISASLSYSTNKEIRGRSTSGGLVTGLLVSLLEQNIIDGAVVIGSDPVEAWKGVPKVARSVEEILSATKSKYAIAPTNVVLNEITKTPGKYALVGLPCQIHGFHKAARINPIIKERVALTIGLFCHAAVEHDPMEMIWDDIQDQSPDVETFISRVGKHPGTPHVRLKDQTLKPVYFPEAKGYRPSSMEVINILYRLYTPARCLTCYDSTSEFADIAVGDPWMAPPSEDIDFLDGYSFALSRTERGERALQKARERGDIALSPLKRKNAKTSNTSMGEEKRWRAFRLIESRSRQGLPVPDYGFKIPKPDFKQLVLTELNLLSHLFCFVKTGRDLILKLTFSKVGYYLLWLNSKKRNFRDWRKVQAAKKDIKES